MVCCRPTPRRSLAIVCVVVAGLLLVGNMALFHEERTMQQNQRFEDVGNSRPKMKMTTQNAKENEYVNIVLTDTYNRTSTKGTSASESVENIVPQSHKVLVGDSSLVRERTASESSLSGRSYVVAMYLNEQLLGSSFDLIQMQCWIKSLQTASPMSAVEPQMRRNTSVLGFSFVDSSLPVVSDVFDMGSWYSQWKEYRRPLAPCTMRSDFIAEIKEFQKKVIVVQVDYKVRNHWECRFTWNIHSLMKDLEQYPLLNVTRKVCISVSKAIPASIFNRLVFGSGGTENVLVILQEWRGIASEERINLRNTPCVFAPPPYSLLKPSASVVKDAQMFANKHLGGFGQYLAVSARFEKVTRKYRFMSVKSLKAAVAAGLKETMPKIDKLKKTAGVDKVYLAYDYGAFGSVTFKEKLYHNSSDLLVKFQEDLYDGKVSYGEYQQSLMGFKFQNPGYVAMVQMTLSSRGKCLFQFGWGHCVDFVKYLFRVFNDGNELCWDCAPDGVCSRD